jgi:hypothetical protein
MSMRSGLLLVACVVLAAGCGGSEEDDVRAAMERVTTAFREGDTETYCDGIVPDTLLPSSVLRRTPVVGGQSGSLGELEDFQQDCGKQGFLEGVTERQRRRTPTEAPEQVRILELEPTQGVDAAALVGRGKEPATLLRIDDEWLLVFDSR